MFVLDRSVGGDGGDAIQHGKHPKLRLRRRLWDMTRWGSRSNGLAAGVMAGTQIILR
jgi:hypothetical protein